MLSLTIIFLLPYLCNAVLYTVYVKTWNEKHAGTDDNIHISVLGNNWMYLGKLDVKGRADNDRSTFLSFRFYNDYSGLIVGGQLSCIMLFTDDDDAWLVQYVLVNVNNVNNIFHNTAKAWLSTDSSEGTMRLTLCR